MTVFHPYLGAPGNIVQRDLAARQRNAAFTVRLRRPPPMPMSDY